MPAEVIAAVVSGLFSAILGSWFGSQVALSQFRRERSFERQLDWYERMMRSIHGMEDRLQKALTFSGEPATDSTHLTKVWRDVQRAHSDLVGVAQESQLYGSAEAVEAALRIAERVQAVADESNGFDPLSAPEEQRRLMIHRISDLSDNVVEDGKPIVLAARKHLGLK